MGDIIEAVLPVSKTRALYNLACTVVNGEPTEKVEAAKTTATEQGATAEDIEAVIRHSKE